jgi:adenylate cyclase
MSPSVIAAAGQFDQPASTNPFGMPRTSSVLWPARPFEGAAKVGLANIATESSGGPRHLPLLFQTDRGLQPSFALRGAALNAGDPGFSIGKVKIAGAPLALDLGYHLPLRFYGPRGTFDTISASSLLSGPASAPALQDCRAWRFWQPGLRNSPVATALSAIPPFVRSMSRQRSCSPLVPR